MDVGTNNGPIPGGFAANDVSVTVTDDPSRFFDSNGDVWAQVHVDTDVAPGGDNRIRIDYTSLTVSTRSEGLVFQAGANEGDTIETYLPDVTASGLGISGLSLGSRVSAENALTTLDTALKKINGHLAQIGAFFNQLGAASNSDSIKVLNEKAAISQMEDADYSETLMNLAKEKILAQTSVSAMSQANVMGAAILNLLR